MAPTNKVLLAIGLGESADSIGISPRTLRLRAANGDIPSVKLGRRLVFKVADLQEFLDRHTRNGRATTANVPVELKTKNRRK